MYDAVIERAIKKICNNEAIGSPRQNLEKNKGIIVWMRVI
jgi:hypothetical protein